MRYALLAAAEGREGPTAELIRSAASRIKVKPGGWNVNRKRGEKRVRRNR